CEGASRCSGANEPSRCSGAYSDVTTAVATSTTAISTHSALTVRSSAGTALASPADNRGPSRHLFCAASAINTAKPSDLPSTIAPYGVASAAKLRMKSTLIRNPQTKMAGTVAPACVENLATSGALAVPV